MSALPEISDVRLELAAEHLLKAKGHAAIYARVGLAEWVAHHFDDVVAEADEYRGRTLSYALDAWALSFLRDGSREAVAYVEEWLARQEAA